MEKHREVLWAYKVRAELAYAEYANDVAGAGRSYTGAMDPTAIKSGTLRQELQRASGRLGAALTAASKSACREVLFLALEEARDEGLDVTPTAALHAARRVLGRGISNRAAIQRFGTQGRTAATKSQIRPEDLAAVELYAREDIAKMLKQIEETRAHLRRQWLLSSRRQAIVHEWRSALPMTTQQPNP